MSPPASATPAPTQGPAITAPQATHLLTTFTQFLTVCIHNILFYRGLYPATTFLTSRAYNLPVHQSRHPAVCAWVQDAVDAARAQIAQGSVERMAVVIYDATGRPMERWMFDLARFPVWEGLSTGDGGRGKSKGKGKERAVNPEDGEEDSSSDKDNDDDESPGGGTGERSEGQQRSPSDVNWTDVDEQLRAAVRRLAYTGEKMAPLPEGCTFTVAVELRDVAEAPIGHPQAWIPTQPNLQPASEDRQTPGKDVGGAKTTPLRAVEAGPLFFECWVEEGKAKLESSLTSSNA